MDDARLPPRSSSRLIESALGTLGVPEEFGGVALDPAHEVQTFALISEEIARGDSGLSDKLVQIWKVSVLLRNVAPRHLQEFWFPRLVKDPGFLLAHCLTEPRGASDRWLPYNAPEAAMQTRAVLKGDEWVINGRKQFISNGYDASLFVVYANTNPKVGMLQGTSSFLVPRGTKGLTIQRCNETLGGRFMNNGEMVSRTCACRATTCSSKRRARQGRHVFQARQSSRLEEPRCGVAAFERTASTCRTTCRAAASSSSTRRWRCASPRWRRPARRPRAAAEGGAAVDERAPDAEERCATW
jgi:alkylation response protein AidB-like acyl-CoA dehydrogenase